MKYQQFKSDQFMCDFRRFICNLGATAIILGIVSLVLAGVYEQQETFAKQQRFGRIENGMKIVMVMKAQQFRHR